MAITNFPIPTANLADLGIGKLKFVSAYASLSAAITAIGATPTTLFIDATSSVTTAITIPPTLILQFINGKQITNGGGGSLTFQGSGISGDPCCQLFGSFSAGDITWTGVYPDKFRPEWWGAVGDDNGSAGTDNLAAFNSVFAAMESGYPYGGTVQLQDGAFYYLSDTLLVRRSVRFLGGAYNTGVPNTYLRFPANTQGLIFHGLSTENGTITTQNSAGSEIRGIGIYGAKGGNNTVCSTSGLNITLTGGTYTQVNPIGSNDGTIPAFPNGSSITLNGFNYLCDITAGDFANVSVIPIQTPRLIAYGNNDGTISTILGQFPSNGDWDGATLTVISDIGAVIATYTISSHTTSVITLASGTPSGTLLCTISGLASQTSQNARLNIYHGIDVRAQVKIADCNVRGFAGHGVSCNSQILPTGIPGGEPNSNNSFFERCISQFNAGNGWFFYGVNSNNIFTSLLNAENNSGYGYFETGTAGSNHFGWHCAFNWCGSFSMTGLIAKNMITNCYTEGQQPSGIAGQSSLVLGGNHGAGIQGNPGAIQNPYLLTRKIDAGNTTDSWQAGYGYPYDQSSTLQGFGVGEDSGSVANGGSKTNCTALSYYLKYATMKAGWYVWGWCNNAIGSLTNNVIALSGGTAAEGGGQLGFPEGFRTGTTVAYVTSFDPKISRMIRGTFTVDPASINANTVSTQTFTLTGAVVSDNLAVNVPSAGLTAGLLVMQVTVSATDTVSITFYNTTASPINEGSASWSYLITR